MQEKFPKSLIPYLVFSSCSINQRSALHIPTSTCWRRTIYLSIYLYLSVHIDSYILDIFRSNSWCMCICNFCLGHLTHLWNRNIYQGSNVLSSCLIPHLFLLVHNQTYSAVFCIFQQFCAFLLLTKFLIKIKLTSDVNPQRSH